jgi:CRISPR-associated protein Csd1
VLSAPEPEEVRELIAAAQTGRAAAADIDPAAFYALGLSASGSRVVVRSWIDTTVGEAKRRLGRWFMLQALVEPDGEEGRPLPAWRLANATTRDPRKDPPAERVVEGLIGLALGGTPPPLELLFAAVRRCRAEQGVTRERAALIKLVLGAHPELTGGREVSEQLDLDNGNPAYLCGRLLAVLDAIQRRALNNPNATIVDKFYGTAASAPASVFGTLLHGARPHLAKLRKDRSTEAAAHALERRLEDVLAPLAAYPKTLTLPEQGLFALGFYHQRAADRRAARERRAERERGEHGEANAATEDDSDE